MEQNFERVLNVLTEGSLPSIIKQILEMESTTKRHNRRVLNMPDEPAPNFDPSEYFLKYASKIKKPKVVDYNRPIKQCYTNSAIIAIAHNKQYMEGWIIVHGVPLRHAWISGEEITIKDNSIHTYYGVKVPISVVKMATNHRRWTMCEGVLHTVSTMNNKELLKVKKAFSRIKQ